MALLALATSAPDGGGEVGLEVEEGDLRRAHLGDRATRGRGLVTAVRGLLEDAGLAAGDIEGLAVDVGPGSFTGVRVGVTTAKTLAWALRVPVVGVGALAALARAAPRNRAVLALRDAGRGGLYYAAYGPVRDGARELEVPAARGRAEEALSHMSGRLAIGEEAPALLGRAACRGDAQVVRADAAAVLAEARHPLAEGVDVSPDASAHLLAPLYLQAPAANAKNDRP